MRVYIEKKSYSKTGFDIIKGYWNTKVILYHVLGLIQIFHLFNNKSKKRWHAQILGGAPGSYIL